jgi:hypothetical protein
MYVPYCCLLLSWKSWNWFQCVVGGVLICFCFHMVADVRSIKGKAIPVQDLRVLGGWGSQISRQSAHEVGKVVSPTHRPPPGNISGTRFWVNPRALVRPEGLYQRKIPLTPLGIETATSRLIAQCLNQMRHGVPRSFSMKQKNGHLMWRCLSVFDLVRRIF